MSIVENEVSDCHGMVRCSFGHSSGETAAFPPSMYDSYMLYVVRIRTVNLHLAKHIGIPCTFTYESSYRTCPCLLPWIYCMLYRGFPSYA